MKRTAILILILALLLAACGPAADPVPTYTAAGTPTAKGVLVYTDPSAYRRYQGAAKYTRLREGPLESFEPSDDYGAVYPYAAARLYTSGEEGQSTEVSARWGLVDASGRILTDGIYASVEPLSDRDNRPEPTVFYPCWVVASVEPDETAGAGNRTGADRVTRYGLISMDGSFMLPLEYSDILPLNDCVLCIRGSKQRSYEVYDMAGRLLFTDAELLRDGFKGLDFMGWGEGPFLVYMWDDRDRIEYWFCDNRGEWIGGPFEDALGFTSGLACVSPDGEKYGYIDETGAWILEPQFDYPSLPNNGWIAQDDANGSCVVYDTTGKLLFTVPSGWPEAAPCGFRAKDVGIVRFLDADGKLLVEGDSSLECLDEDTFWEQSKDGGLRIFRLNGPELSLSVYIRSFTPGTALLEGKAVRGYIGYSPGRRTAHYCFVPWDLSAIYEIGEHAHPTNSDSKTVDSTIDQCTNEIWYLCWNGEAWDAVSEAGEIRSIPLRIDSPVFRGDRIMVLTDRACVYLDREGKVLFSYPLDAED